MKALQFVLPSLALGGALIASAFIAYAGSVGFGPKTLTGGAIQIALGAALHLLSAYLIGRMIDRVRRLQALE